MKTFFRGLIFIIFLIAATIAGLIWGIHHYGPEYVAGYIEKANGYRVNIESLFFNPATATLEVGKTQIANPDRFPDPDFVDLEYLNIDIAPRESVSGEVVADSLDIHFNQFAIAINRAEENNAVNFIESLSRSFREDAANLAAQAAPAPVPATDGDSRHVAVSRAGFSMTFGETTIAIPESFLIRKFHLTMDQLKVTDATTRNRNHNTTYDVRLDITLQDVTDFDTVIDAVKAELERKKLLIGLESIIDSVGGVLTPENVGDILGFISRGIPFFAKEKTEKAIKENIPERPKSEEQDGNGQE